jgi:hypothetical protein
MAFLGIGKRTAAQQRKYEERQAKREAKHQRKLEKIAARPRNQRIDAKEAAGFWTPAGREAGASWMDLEGIGPAIGGLLGGSGSASQGGASLQAAPSSSGGLDEILNHPYFLPAAVGLAIFAAIRS